MKSTIRFNSQRKDGSPYMVDYSWNGKRIRKSFKTEKEARDYLNLFDKSLRKAQSAFWSRQLTPEQVFDINAALNLLPYGETLLRAVQKLIATNEAQTTISISNVVDMFLATKKTTAKSAHKMADYRLKSFLVDFGKWELLNSNKIRDWLAGQGKPKTIHHYFNLLKEFFGFCSRRDYCTPNPMDKIHSSDFPKIARSIAEFFTVDETKGFFEFLKAKYPKYTAWFAIAFFTGIRRAELNRLKPTMFDFERKEILLPSTITKTGDTWLMTDLPENLWKWITEGEQLIELTDHAHKIIMADLKEATGIEWKHNTARHSFATYHLSLYRDSAKTSLLLRHRNRDTLWQHYLGGLTSKADAEAYFKI